MAAQATLHYNKKLQLCLPPSRENCKRNPDTQNATESAEWAALYCHVTHIKPLQCLSKRPTHRASQNVQC